MISKDPYKILGVSPTASDAEIKSAYKELVKKYHPDQYQDNPLADVAEEKMSEINAASSETSTAFRCTNGYWRKSGKAFWKISSVPICELQRFVTATVSTLYPTSHTFAKTLSATLPERCERRRPTVKKSERLPIKE